MSQQTKRAPGRPKKAEPQAAAPVLHLPPKEASDSSEESEARHSVYEILVEEVLLISFNSAVSPCMTKNRTLCVRFDTARTRTQYGWTSKAKMPKKPWCFEMASLS